MSEPTATPLASGLMRAITAMQDLQADGMSYAAAFELVVALEAAPDNLRRFALAYAALRGRGESAKTVRGWLSARGYFGRDVCPECRRPLLPKSTVAHDRLTRRTFHEECAPDRERVEGAAS